MTNLLELLNINIDTMSNDELIELTMERRRSRRSIAKQGVRGSSKKVKTPKKVKAPTLDLSSVSPDMQAALLKAFEENYGQSEDN